MKRLRMYFLGMFQITLFVILGLSSAQATNSKKHPHKCWKHNEKCFTETFEQPVTETGSVDVLFVVQTSQSIAAQRQLITTGINSFLDTLPENADVNVGVMLSHGSTSAESGRLYQVESEPVVLKASELSDAEIQTYLTAKLTQVSQDPDAGGGEEGLYSLFHGITTPALLSESQSLGFFRPDAALAVVFIGDRRDICAIVPPRVPAETDPVKIDARIRDCEGLTAAGLTNQLKLLKGTQPLQVSGIIYADEPAPAGKEIGYGYTDMISLNAGVAIDIANDDIAAGLASIAELIGQQMEIQYEFTLSKGEVDPHRLSVKVNGQNVPYKLEGNTVIITQPIPSGAVVTIAYCVKKAYGHHHHHYWHYWKKWYKEKCKKYRQHSHHGHHHNHGKKDKHCKNKKRW